MKTSAISSVLSQNPKRGKKKRGLTLAQVKAVPELRHLSDDQAREIIRSLRIFAELCFSYVSRNYPEITQPFKNSL